MQLFKAARPFLKWAGGKFKMLDKILNYVPDSLEHWVEPFVGGGAVFLNVQAKKYTLWDVNPDLIHLYRLLQINGSSFISDAKQFFKPAYNTPHMYYQLREQFNHCSDLEERALLFLYLNRHGFNGLCRYNKQRKFNVPFGGYVAPYFPERELLFFHEKSQYAEFKCGDFQKAFEDATQDAMIYADPPYVPLTTTASFTHYFELSFAQAQQQKLATCARDAAQSGRRVLLSNHDTPQTREWYQGAQIETFSVRRAISAQARGRAHAQELLALFD